MLSRFAVVGLCAAVLATTFSSVHCAAIIEDHSASHAAANLSLSLAQVFDDALPDELLRMVLAECAAFETFERQERARREAAGGAYVYGKGGTYWRPLFNKYGEFLRPRFGIEAAIQLLYTFDFGTSSPHPRVLGGEWWVQRRTLKEDIGFHHDKDEAMASLQHTMKFPEVSTVTYLTGLGAPTVIFNQTTPDGNGAMPITPRRGVISYPKENRHLRFQGNLQHGVPAFLNPDHVELRGASSKNERITFLVNWWHEQPMPPNCIKVSTKTAKRIGVYNKEGVSELMMSSSFQVHRNQAVQKRSWILPRDPGNREMFEVTVPGDDVIWFELPRARDKGYCYDVQWRDTESGHGDGIYANICRLKLHGGLVNSLFRDIRPKVLVFTQNEVDELKWMRPIATEFEKVLRFVVADPVQTLDALRTFGLRISDCPTAAIHVTHPTEAKYLMPWVSGKRLELNAQNMQLTIQTFLGGKLFPIGGNDAD